MKHFLLLFCLLGMVVKPIHAQTIVGPSTKHLRTYSGTATKYTADGQQIVGSVNVEVGTNRAIAVRIVLGITTTQYAGTLKESTNGRTGVAYIIAVDDQYQPVSGAEKIPLFIKKTVVSGGILGQNSDALVFRAERGAISTNQP